MSGARRWLLPAADRTAADRPVSTASSARPARPVAAAHAGASLLALQATHGNRHVQQVVQTKLTVGPAGDRYEREADRVARQVVGDRGIVAGGEAPEQVARHPEIQRISSGTATGAPGAAAGGSVGAAGGPVDSGVQHAIEGARGTGQALPEQVRAPMEQALGADFGGVRIHTDARADQLNQSLQARAFTTGRDIFFRRGAHDLTSRSGQEVLAHELTHVVQQAGGDHAVQRAPGQNAVTTTHTDRVRQPLSVLHAAFEAGFKSLATPETYTFLKETFDPAKPPAKLTNGVKDWEKPNRPAYETAKLTGTRPGGGARASSPPQTLYGYLGMMERAVFGRPVTPSATYQGGHFVSDEILGQDSYTEFNFAPQDEQFNSPLWREVEKIARAGPTDKTTGKRAPSWDYTVKVRYPADYTRTAKELADVGVLPAAIAKLNPAKVVTFPRRVPDLWEAELKAPANHVFENRTLKQGTDVHDAYVGKASDIVKASAIKKQGSGEVALGMESLRIQMSASGKEKVIGGEQQETFAALQYVPEDMAQQPARTVIGPGGLPLPVMVPQPRVDRLTKPCSLTTAIDTPKSADRMEIEAQYPLMAKYIWTNALPWALKQVKAMGPVTPVKVLKRAVDWSESSSSSKKRKVTKPQKTQLNELAGEFQLKV